MKHRIVYVSILTLTVAIGIMIAFAYHYKYPRFQFVSSGMPYTGAITYTFRSPANDCIGCMAETGSVDLYVDYTSPESTRHLVGSRWETEFVERGDKVDDNGTKIGERAVTVRRSDDKIVGAEIFWTEGDVFWSIHAPTLRLARAFEASDSFRRAKPGIPVGLK